MLTFLGYLYLKFVAITSRIRVRSSSPKTAAILKDKPPFIFSYWHEHSFFLLHFFRVHNVHVLTTPKANRDFISSVASLMGLKVAQGSLEGGGRHALVTIMNVVKNGRAVGIPASGPLSPEHRCKIGCLIVAQEANVPILGISWKARVQKLVPLGSEKILVPLPFNLIEIYISEPVMVDKHTEYKELESIKDRFSKTLDQLSTS